MGVLSVVYLGGHQTQSGLDSDRAAAAGQSAMRDFKVRMMDSPATWRTANGKLISASATDTAASTSLLPLQPHTQRYFLDARGVANGITQGFPAGGSVVMPRITLVNQHSVYIPIGSQTLTFTINNGMLAPQANEVFQFQDDLVFTVNENDALAAPAQTMDPPGSNQKRFSARDFSWAATIVRDTPGSDYTVSVVVMHGRNNPAATDEAEVSAAIIGGGIGGGDVRLTGTATTGPAIEKLRNGHWVMLMNATAASWYRIVTSSEYVAASYERDFTLAGRDWNGTTAKAAILPGVVGVYERTERLTSDWPY
jgi:hypothetical protein